MCFKMTTNGNNVRMSVNELTLYYIVSGNSSERALNLISTVSGDLVGCNTNFLIRGFRGETKRKKESTNVGFWNRILSIKAFQDKCRTCDRVRYRVTQWDIVWHSEVQCDTVRYSVIQWLILASTVVQGSIRLQSLKEEGSATRRKWWQIDTNDATNSGHLQKAAINRLAVFASRVVLQPCPVRVTCRLDYRTLEEHAGVSHWRVLDEAHDKYKLQSNCL